jgi:hypothetical protein
MGVKQQISFLKSCYILDEHDNEATWDATNGAMVSADCLNAKDRVELLKFLLIDGNITGEQKGNIMKQLCSIAGI